MRLQIGYLLPLLVVFVSTIAQAIVIQGKIEHTPMRSAGSRANSRYVESSENSSSESSVADNVESKVSSATSAVEDATKNIGSAISKGTSKAVRETERVTDETADATKNIVNGAIGKTKKVTHATLRAIAPKNENAFAESLHANPTGAPPSTSIRANNPRTGLTTVGFIEYLEEALLPIDRIFYLFLDSFLRNTRGVGLPCKIYSFIPLEGECTPINRR